MNNFVKLLNEYDGFSMILLTGALVFVTLYYAIITKKLWTNSTKSIEQNENIKSINLKKDKNTKNNYLLLLNAEIFMNVEMYILALAYFENKIDIKLLDRFLIRVKGGGLGYKDTLKLYITNYIKSDYWDDIYSECPKYFSYALMQELVGYYAGVHHSRIYSIDGMSESDYISFIRGQLVSSYKCFNLIDGDGIKLRRDEYIEIERFKIKFDVNSEQLVKLQ